MTSEYQDDPMYGVRPPPAPVIHLKPYPCDYGVGDGWGRGYHNFSANSSAVIVCAYCGKKPPE